MNWLCTNPSPMLGQLPCLENFSHQNRSVPTMLERDCHQPHTALQWLLAECTRWEAAIRLAGLWDLGFPSLRFNTGEQAESPGLGLGCSGLVFPAVTGSLCDVGKSHFTLSHLTYLIPKREMVTKETDKFMKSCKLFHFACALRIQGYQS